MHQCKTGEIVIGGINGFNIFNPDSVLVDQSHPQAYITDLKILNESVIPNQEINGKVVLTKSILGTEKITLNHDDYVFSLDFLNLTYSKSDKNRFRYKLHNFDKKWNITSKDRRYASYSNLPGGTYTFEVAGTNKDGLWSENTAKLTIEIIPPFWTTWWFRISGALVALLILYGYYRNKINLERKQKQRLEKQVAERTNDLQEANLRIKKEKEQTLSSIKYAKTIQQAMLPSEERLNRYFDTFNIYKPKDIVSGDFFWSSRFENKDKTTFYLALADCTGHGVPGAFMSTISYRLLNLVINERKISNTADALELIDIELRNALNQEKTENNDGMDIGLCRFEFIDGEVSSLQFSGAKIPLITYSDGQITKIEATRRSIGGRSRRSKKIPFIAQNIDVKQGQRLFLSSDGIIDQHSESRKRYGTVAFIELLESSSSMSLHEQKKIIANTIEEYKGNESQRDDISIIGIQL